MPSVKITLSPASVARGLCLVLGLLVLASIASDLAAYLWNDDIIFGLVPLFNLREEQNLPTFFATFLLLCAGLLLWLIAAQKRPLKETFAAHWLFLAAVFFYLAVDEAGSIHELLGPPVRAAFGGNMRGIFHFAWVIPGLLAVAVLALGYVKFFLHLPRRTRTAFFAAAALYLAGAIGLEMVGGRQIELVGRDWVYNTLASVEEVLELGGSIVFIWGLLDYLAENHPDLRFRIDPARKGN